jgi:plasmid stability protein
MWAAGKKGISRVYTTQHLSGGGRVNLTEICEIDAFPVKYAAVDKIKERAIAMTLTIELPEEKTAALAAKAKARGLSAEEYVRQILEQDLAPEWLRKSWESSRETGLDQLSSDEIDAEIAAARTARHESDLQPGS